MFILHMHNHAGWNTQIIEANTLVDALTKGLDRTAKFLSQKYSGKYKIEHDDPNSKSPRYRVIWDDEEPKTFVLGTPRYKGDVWWSDRFQVGEYDDCEACGGTGINHYNSFRQCWACGNPKENGMGSGKKLIN